MRKIHNTLLAIAVSFLSTLSVRAQKVEYFWDSDPGVGKGQVLELFSGTALSIQTAIDVSALSPGVHQLGLRTLNDIYSSATYYRSFYIPAENEKVTRIEYGWDQAPSYGEGEVLSFGDGSTIELSQSLKVGSLSAGMHTLYLQVLSNNHHSMTYTRSFYIPETPHAVEAIEYYFDSDPGVGNGTLMSATLAGESLTKAFTVDTDGLTAGVHQLGIRTLTDGTWSATKVRQFLVGNVEDSYVARLEYFWDTDPGMGNGQTVAITPGREVTLDFEVDMRELAEGSYNFGIRSQSGAGFWSNLSWFEGIEYNGCYVELDEASTTEPAAEANANVRVKRSISAGQWSTICLPFAMTETQCKAAFGEDVQLADFNDYAYDDAAQTINVMFKDVTAMEANHPYIIKVSEAISEFTVDGVDIDPQEAVIDFDTSRRKNQPRQFVGTYTAGTVLEWGMLFLSDNKFWYSVGETKMKGYRGYFNFNDLLPDFEDNYEARINMLFDEGASGIGSVKHSEQPDGRYYNLAGQRVENPKKGLYIMNNKKVVVR